MNLEDLVNGKDLQQDDWSSTAPTFGCKKELDCGVILKRDMPDGYTETTHVYNLDKIIQIYKNHGGVKL